MYFLVLVLLLVGCIAPAYSQGGYTRPYYCQAPLPNPSENTDGLTLQMVQVITRHGDRTPLYSTMNNLMDEWDCDLSSFETPSLANNGDQTNFNYLFRKVYMPNREYLPGNCSEGQLTNIGYQQHLELGATLRELYVNKYQLLPEELDESLIWVRSTDVPRTLQSAQGHINGLYPASTTKSGTSAATVIDINTMDGYYENMYPNPAICPILDSYFANLTQTPTYVNFTKSYQALQNQVTGILGLSSFPSWGNLMDLFFATQCHNLTLPAGITQDIVNQTYEASFFESYYQIASNAYVGRLAMASFLQELIDNLQNFAQGVNTQIKYYVFSGHDSTVGPLMTLFTQVPNWPAYASSVQLELWSDDNSGQYVQLKYNGQSVLISGCDSVMCEYNQFITNIQNNVLIPNYSQACQSSA